MKPASRRSELIRLIKNVVPHASSLPYPENCVPLHSEEGLELLEGSIGNFEKLAECFVPQGPLQCAVTSITIGLNVCRRPGSPKISVHQLQEELRAELRPAHPFFSVSLAEIGELAERYAMAQRVYASETDCDTFRMLAIETLEAGGSVIVNFKRSSLGYASPFAGHCSPLGAYNPGTDEFLVMDVAQRSFQPVWVSAELLFKGMCTIEKPRDESAVGVKSRGFILIDPYGASPLAPTVAACKTSDRSSPWGAFHLASLRQAVH